MGAQHFVIQPMQPADWHSVRAIYLEGIAARNATFETEAPAWEKWDASHLPFGRLVARAGNGVQGWAALSRVSARQCYSGVAEASVYVAGASRGVGIGRALLEALVAESEQHGIWTLQGAVFPENLASLSLLDRCGFREVGRRERLAQLDGVWRDVLLLERRSPKVGR
jgi:L-amino acid N-acyltransferase YncA